MSILSENEIGTLREMASYEAYYFRRGTSAKLVAKGLAEYIGNQKLKRRPVAITEAGRSALDQRKEAAL